MCLGEYGNAAAVHNVKDENDKDGKNLIVIEQKDHVFHAARPT